MMNNNTSRQILFFGILLVFILPLLNLPPLFSPPAFGKTIAFRIILSLLIFFAIFCTSGILRTRIKERIAQWRRPEFLGVWLLIGLFITFLLATIFSLDPNHSLWASPIRAGGFVNFASYIIFALFLFTMLKRQEWRAAWDVLIGVGVVIGIIAVYQALGFLSNILPELWTGGRPIATLGNPVLLASYLLFPAIAAVMFGLKEQNTRKKYAYFLASLFLFFAILLTEVRGVYLGLSIAFSYFLLFYPFKSLKWSLITKGIFFVLGLLVVGTIFFINFKPEMPDLIRENTLLQSYASRMRFKVISEDPRFDAWEVSWNALGERPWLGYGPENFSIAFDKHYDASLPGIQHIPGTMLNWWTRAHNSFLDFSIQAGILAGIFYILLFVVLFWQLQGVKKRRPGDTILAHGIQTVLIGYFVANFFAFDTFSTYLVFFFTIAYALWLIRTSTEKPEEKEKLRWSLEKIIIFIPLLMLLIWFNWQYNVHPLLVNREINIAKQLAENEECEQALLRIQRAFDMDNPTIHAYVGVKYSDIIKKCDGKTSQSTLELAKTGYAVVNETLLDWPFYTRSWISLGRFTNVIIEKDNSLTEEEKTALIAEAHTYFKKAQELSPEHQEIYIDWTKTFIVAGDYAGAKAKAEECVALNSSTAECLWVLGLAEEYLGEHKKAEEVIQAAVEYRLDISTPVMLNQLAAAYLVSGNNKELAITYEKLLVFDPNNLQLHASLAVVYKELGQYDKAREEALKIIEIDPSSQEKVEEFLNTLLY